MKKREFLDANGNVVVLNEREQAYANSLETRFNEAIVANDVSQLGAQIDITTLTQILKSVSSQKFYQIDIEKYIDVDTDGGWADQVLQVREFLPSQPMSGFIDQAAHGAKLTVSEAAVNGLYVPALTWAKKIEFSIAELNQAALLGNFSLIAAKERSRKKSYDLDMQQLTFLGYNKVKGLLNQDDAVTVDTATITDALSALSYTDINNFVRQVVEKFRANCARTAYPNRFVIPESDFNGLASQVNPQFPIKNKLQLIKEAFDTICPTPVEILPCVYSDKNYNKIGSTRYALYNKDFDTVRLQKAIDYTPTMMNNIDGWQIVNTAFARTFGVLLNRPKEVLYFDRDIDSSSSSL
ncbi:MAG: major capsid family protein [Bacteroidales bacterium]|nr:major capsid family protein [Bacteroidales bacterium]